MIAINTRGGMAAGAVALALLLSPGTAAAQNNRTFVVTGTLTDEGVECPALRGDDGRLYTLAGDVSGFSTGDRVRVRGRVAEISFCQQGTTLEVRAIRQARRPAR
jgi:hypothetical protein